MTWAGVEEDFEVWYLREHGRVVSTVAAVTGRPSIAGDCADEAFTRACERWSSVRGMASPGGWVTTVALNEARRRLRRSGHERRLLVWVAATAPVEAPPPAWSPEVWEALAALPRREREAVALRYVADLPVGEIATIMGIAPGTAASTLHSARARLARTLAPDDEAEDGTGTPPAAPTPPTSASSPRPAARSAAGDLAAVPEGEGQARPLAPRPRPAAGAAAGDLVAATPDVEESSDACRR